MFVCSCSNFSFVCKILFYLNEEINQILYFQIAKLSFMSFATH